MNEWLGTLVAQQQTVRAEQQKLIAELQARLAERDGRSAALEAQVRRLERELLGPKSEKIKVPPVDRDLGTDEPSEEEQARRREEIAQKRRHNALAVIGRQRRFRSPLGACRGARKK